MACGSGAAALAAPANKCGVPVTLTLFVSVADGRVGVLAATGAGASSLRPT